MKRMAAMLLPDDAVREILLRVSTEDVAALFRSAVTCKHWCALIADRSFFQLRWPENAQDPSSFLGFYGCERHQPPSVNPISSGSVVGTHRRPLTFFISGASDDVLTDASPLSAWGSRLLAHVRGDPGTHSVRLAVCNPLTGSCDVLPMLCCSSAVLSLEDCCSEQEARAPSNGHSTFFKVLAIVRGRHDQDGNIRTFLSSQPNWSSPKRYFDDVWLNGKLGCKILTEANKVVICRGVAHWLGIYFTDEDKFQHYFTCDVKVKTDHISLTDISIPGNQLAIKEYSRLMLTVTMEGRLSLFHLKNKELELSTWTREDDGTWLRTRVVDLKLPTQLVGDHVCVSMWLGERSGTFIIHMHLDMHRRIYKTDIETGAMEDVTTKKFEDGCTIEVPMEIDWPAFFMSRLGVYHYSQTLE